MRIHLILAAFALAVFAATDCLAQEPAGKDPATVDANRVKELVAKLGDEDFQTRENATNELIAMGPDVVELVEAETASSKDPEVTCRAELIVNRLFVSGTWKESLEKKLAESRVSFSFNDVPCTEMLSEIAGKENINIVLDPRTAEMLDNNLTFVIRDITLGDMLKLLTEQRGASYALLDGAVVVGTRENLMEWPADPLEGIAPMEGWQKKIVKRLGMRVELSVPEPTSLSDLVALVRDNTKVSIVMDESPEAKVGGADFSRKMEILAKDISAAQALNLVLKPQGLGYCLKDKGVFISTKEIVDGLREKK
jgi:hypothetical protein